MDTSEAIALEFLTMSGYSDVSFEPDGNVPPDFVVDGRIAVEVRRLNQRDHRGRALEADFHPLLDRIEVLLDSYGNRGHGQWWIAVTFGRPLAARKSLAPSIRAFLDEIAAGPAGTVSARRFGSCIELDVRPATPRGGPTFQLGIINDTDAGGLVVAEVYASLLPCIAEKSIKTKPFRDHYSTWWLVLIDQVGYGMSELSRQQFRELPRIEHDWDRIVIVNPLKPERFFDVS